MSINKVAVIVPNWDGEKYLAECLDSLVAQSITLTILVVDNGSKDNSLNILGNYKNIIVLKNSKNLGFAGGVNKGIEYALRKNFDAVALFNNDAVADKNWLKNLIACMNNSDNAGITTSKFLSFDKKYIDSTGEEYSIWGLPYPRGRNETKLNTFDNELSIFGASGGASLYRCSMLKQIGIFDNDFFAYYEDVDISFRAQLAGYKIYYEPTAVAYHRIGATSGKVKGFTTYQTIKNLPWVIIKNVPIKYFLSVALRFTLVYIMLIASAIIKGHFLSAIKGLLVSMAKTPKKIYQRRQIQKSRKVSSKYIWQIMIHDLPPNATKLRKIRQLIRKFVDIY